MIDAMNYDCLRASGRNPDVVHDQRLLVGGGGNGGSNTTVVAAVLGIETCYIDLDRAEPKNLPHSPFLDATPGPEGVAPFKAELLAKAHVALGRRPGLVAHWAGVPVQAIPLGLIRRFDAMIVGIDDGASRAWAAHAAAMLGIPSVVAGFFPPTGNFVATGNRDPDDPCYFCLRPHESAARASCSLYAPPDGCIHAAIETAPAAVMAIAVEAVTRFWADDWRYDGTVFRLDLDDGSAGLTTFRRNPQCRGPHERLPEIDAAPFGPDAPAEAVLELARSDGLDNPVLELPSPYVVAMPCRNCGAAVPVNAPEWTLSSAPVCPGGCAKGARSVGGGTWKESFVGRGSALADLPLHALGLGPLGLCIVEDEVTGEVRAYELPGEIGDVFTTVGPRADR